MPDETVLKYTADFSQIKRELDEATAKVGKLEASLERTAKKFGDKSPQATMVRNALDQTMAKIDKQIQKLEKLQQNQNKDPDNKPGAGGRSSADQDLERRYKRESLKYYRDFSSTFGRTSSSLAKTFTGGITGLASGQGLMGFTKGLSDFSSIMLASGSKSIIASLIKSGIIGGAIAKGTGKRAGASVGAGAAGAEGEEAAGVAEAVETGAGLGILRAFLSLPGPVKFAIGAVAGLTVGGITALTYASKDVYARGKRAAGFGANIGEMTAFEDAASRFVDPDNVLKAMQQAKFDITSPAYTSMRIAGLNPAEWKDPAVMAEANVVRAQTELKGLYAQNPQTLLTMAHARGFQNRGFSDEDIVNLATGSQKELNEVIQKASKAAPGLDISDEERKKFDDLITDFDLFGDHLKTAGEKLVENLVDPTDAFIGKMTEADTKLEQFAKWIAKIMGIDPDAPSADASAVSMEAGGAGGKFRIPGMGGNSGGRGPSLGGGFSGFGGKAPGAPVSNARTGVAMKAAMDQLREEGVPEEHLKAAAAILVGEAQSESSLNPDAHHDPYHGVYTGYGIYGARDPPTGGGVMRRSRMLNWLKEHGYASDSLEGQVKEMAHSAMHDFPGVARILRQTTPGSMLDDTYGVTKGFESPAVVNDRRGAVRGAFDKGPAATDDKSAGKQSMNNMSHFQGNNKGYAIRIDNPAGATYSVAGGMLGATNGNFGNA